MIYQQDRSYVLELKTKKSSRLEKEIEPGTGTKIFLSNLSWGCWSHFSLFLHVLHSFFLQGNFFHFSIHIVENCYPLPTGSIMLHSRHRLERKRIWGLEFKHWPLFITLFFFFFFAETVNIAQRSPLMTSKYLNTRYLSRLYCSMTCHPSKGKSLIWPLLISFCVSKNLNQNFTHFQCFTVNEPNVRSTVYSPKQPFHNSPLSSSFKIFNSLKKILYKNIQSNENHLKLLPPNIVFTYGFLSFFMFSSVQLLSRV